MSCIYTLMLRHFLGLQSEIWALNEGAFLVLTAPNRLTKLSPLSNMKALFCLFVMLGLALGAFAQEPKKFVLYAVMQEDTPVTVAEGAKWMMDKGDTFPVIMFKEQQTQVILQLAGTTFPVATAKVKIVEAKDATDEMLLSYRRTVINYLESSARKWKEAAAEKDKAEKEAKEQEQAKTEAAAEKPAEAAR